MDDIIIQFISQITLAISGSLVTGIVWLVKSVYRAQHDIECAHEKISEIKEEVQRIKLKERL